MTEKRYFDLNDEHNVLALLRKGYSFIEIGNRIVYARNGAASQVAKDSITEAIPHEEPLSQGEFLLLSDFLKNRKQENLVVDSGYF